MSEHNLILEFYKPTYNLDFDYDGDGGLDLHFTNVKGEFFMTMNDSYNSVYIEDEDCEFSKGEMFATVDLGDLVERIVTGEFRQTNGKAVSDWGKRFIGDGEEQIEFNGKNYADGSLFWDDFFKEMPKDEIKDFIKFCESYIYLPNIEVDTVSDKWDFENGKVELKSNGKWGITINDDYTIFSVESFTCDSTDAFIAYDVAISESNEDNFYESKKSTRKSLKESISDDDIVFMVATTMKEVSKLRLNNEFDYLFDKKTLCDMIWYICDELDADYKFHLYPKYDHGTQIRVDFIRDSVNVGWMEFRPLIKDTFEITSEIERMLK